MFWASSTHYNLRLFTHDCPSCEISYEKSETDFCHMFHKNGLIGRKIILWATNFSPLLCSVQVTLHVFSFNIASSINLNLSFFHNIHKSVSVTSKNFLTFVSRTSSSIVSSLSRIFVTNVFQSCLFALKLSQLPEHKEALFIYFIQTFFIDFLV